MYKCKLPLLSVITPSFNQGLYIEDAIKSVLNQNYANFEHIVIDGGSSDNTIEILKSYPHLKWISEKDNGQADAFNKGLSLSSGEIIGWIDSDDFYVENCFESVIEYFKDINTNWIIGNVIYFNEISKESRRVNTSNISYNTLINNADIVKQPSTFFRRIILNQVNGLNNYYMVMDYDLFIRLSKITTPKMVNEYYAYFRLHDNQKTSPIKAYKNLSVQISEINEILKRENVHYYKRKIILFNKYICLIKCKIKYILFKYLRINSMGNQR